jgi:hypothetical protein
VVNAKARVAREKARVAKENTAMTDRSAAPRRGPGVIRLAAASLALVAIVFILLAERVAAGSDPVLRSARRAVPQPVVVHRIVRRVVIDTTITSHGGSGSGRTTVSSSPVSTSESGGGVAAPVTRSS